ncbi:SAVED domain-containing protein [Miltoncostaea marina]|uniref:SAVED domain-containing protein n=1 Tax=Miltoncostaea marina TaxID=2843215 RepID=UPI001C3CF1C7|nr:SAVED domain-containing protein [Miltoncostaea marina]
MSGGSGLPSPSGARLSGDDYQHLLTWFHALQLLRKESGVTRVEFEVGYAGNVDDLVVHRRDKPTLYHQIKYVVAQAQPLTHEWFTTPSRTGGPSPLKRFHGSYQALATESGPPEMVLITNRLVTHADPILRHLGGRDAKLVPRLALEASGSASGEIRKDWADHLGISEQELLGMLEHFAIKPGGASLEELRDMCRERMSAVGLRGLPDDVIVAVGMVRELISTGCRCLDPDTLREATRSFARTEREATLLIQAIDHSDSAESATEALDWVELFVGDSPALRRRLHDPRGWSDRLKPELDTAAGALRAAGYESVRLEGAFRLSVGFAAGDALPRTTAVRLSYRDYDSHLTPGACPVEVASTELGLGDDIVIGISVSTDLTADATEYLQNAGIPAARFVNITPAVGPGQTSIPDAAAGLGFVYAAFEEIRRQVNGLDGTAHLFMACPNGIAVMLGHLWNRVPDTQLHDDANDPGKGYFPSFHLMRR